MTLTFNHQDMVNGHHHTNFADPTSNGSLVMHFFSSNFFLVNYLVTYGIVTDRRTDGKRQIRAPRALAQVDSKNGTIIGIEGFTFT